MQKSKQFPIDFKKSITNRHGYASVEFLFFIPIIFFMIFAPIDYWMVCTQSDQVDQLKTYYLDRVRVSGWLSTTDETNLKNSLTTANYTNITITAKKTTDNTSIKQSDGASPVVRDAENPLNSEIYLEIKCTPTPKAFALGALIGNSSTSTFYIKRAGRALSEYVGS